MNRAQVEGNAKEVSGKVQTQVGKAQHIFGDAKSLDRSGRC